VTDSGAAQPVTGWGIGTQRNSSDISPIVPGTPSGTILSATDTTISMTGNNKEIVFSYYGGATTTLDNCTIMGSGTNNYALLAYNGVIDVRDSTVTSLGSNAAFVAAGAF
jgi:hypothetical protein